MPTPATRTPVRIARGSYSNLNGSVSDLQDGEISYAEDQNKLYIKEGSSLVALTYTPANPAFTGTITGVNLTLSGNLTVNGTQTIINTQTLDVEDKQIEIGKVSNPSDTTADQGGIILKGASDKSILWYDSTDSWTFNQGIVINGNATVTGTGTSINNAIDIIYNHSSGVGQINVDSSGGNTSLKLGTSNSGSITTALTIDSSQNATFAGGAGIGTADITGTVQLDVVGAIGGVRAKVTTNNGGYKIFEGLSSGGASVFSVTHNGAVTAADTVSDSKGNLRSIPMNTQSSAYTLVASDAGKVISISSGGVTVNNSVHSSGDAITIINNSGSDQTITQGSGLSIYNSADASTGNRVLASRGMATIWFRSAGAAYISGAGLS